jgi:hypothetical protein
VKQVAQGDEVNIAFQVEALTNSDGSPEIVKVECEPTTAQPSEGFDVEELGVGAWEFQFVLPADFDETYPLFNRFGRYGFNPQAVGDACVDAWHNMQGTR